MPTIDMVKAKNLNILFSLVVLSISIKTKQNKVFYTKKTNFVLKKHLYLRNKNNRLLISYFKN